MKLVGIALVASLAACGGRTATGGATPPRTRSMTPAQIAQLATKSIVLIKTPTGLGTGFVVWNDRVATNLHIIVGAREAVVRLADGREISDPLVLAIDKKRDLAILRVNAPNLIPLALGDSDAVRAGDHVVAIGHPMGLGNTVSDGLVGAIRQLDPEVTLLQVSAPISPGSSGGPIFNDKGEVIGIATAFSAEGQNLNFGVPVKYLKPLLLADDPKPLAEMSRELDVGLLAGCSAPEVEKVIRAITDAIAVGAPKYNKGDQQGCFDGYQATALKLLAEVSGCPGVRESLLGGVSAANKSEGAKEKAWAMRHAFDRILDAFKRVIDEAEQRGLTPAP